MEKEKKFGYTHLIASQEATDGSWGFSGGFCTEKYAVAAATELVMAGEKNRAIVFAITPLKEIEAVVQTKDLTAKTGKKKGAAK